MPYTALPDHRISYDNDGTVVGRGVPASGLTGYASGAEMQALQGMLPQNLSLYCSQGGAGDPTLWLFFPEQRELTGVYAFGAAEPYRTDNRVAALYGSNDTTNGLDGTWETASLPNGVPPDYTNNYQWRAEIKAVSFTGGKRTVRIRADQNGSGADAFYWRLAHLYGEKVAGQTPDDLIYIDHDTTPGVEYAAPEDFGDQPLGTTVVRQFRLKNASTSRTANSINVQCNDADFAISTDGVTWVVTITIASLGPGAQSSTMYVRCTTPAPGNLLGPRFGRIVTTVASYT